MIVNQGLPFSPPIASLLWDIHDRMDTIKVESTIPLEGHYPIKRGPSVRNWVIWSIPHISHNYCVQNLWWGPWKVSVDIMILTKSVCRYSGSCIYNIASLRHKVSRFNSGRVLFDISWCCSNKGLHQCLELAQKAILVPNAVTLKERSLSAIKDRIYFFSAELEVNVQFHQTIITRH